MNFESRLNRGTWNRKSPIRNIFFFGQNGISNCFFLIFEKFSELDQNCLFLLKDDDEMPDEWGKRQILKRKIYHF